MRDKHHNAIVEAVCDSTETLVTAWPVLTETCHRMLCAGADAQLRFMRAVASGAIRIFALRVAHLQRIEALMIKYRDSPMDLADNLLVLAAENRGDGRILSTDMHNFGAYRCHQNGGLTQGVQCPCALAVRNTNDGCSISVGGCRCGAP